MQQPVTITSSTRPAPAGEPAATVSGLVIECDSCVMRATSACTDCLVTYLYEPHEHDAVVFDLAEQRAVRWFAEAGLVPTLRHRAAEPA